MRRNIQRWNAGGFDGEDWYLFSSEEDDSLLDRFWTESLSFIRVYCREFFGQFGLGLEVVSRELPGNEGMMEGEEVAADLTTG